MQQTLYTVGHSTHVVEHFISLLQMHGITALCDVRSKPYSRANPQFNREELKKDLKDACIAYVFLGKELGGRTADAACYDRGRVDYGRLARTELFRRGLERVREGAAKYRIALMCAEKEPLDCHRTVLVARHLSDMGFAIEHIHADGTLESHADAVQRLVRNLALSEQEDMFRSPAEVAYEIQGRRIAYALDEASAPAGARSAVS